MENHYEETQELNTETVTESQPAEETANLVYEPLEDSATETAAPAKRKFPPKKIWIPALAVLLILAITIPILYTCLTNTYKTPLNLMVDFKNTKEFSDPFKASLKMLNGFSEKELNELFKILKKSDFYEDLMDNMFDSVEDTVEEYEYLYGEDYRFSYRIEDKEKLEKEDLKEFKQTFKDVAKNLKTELDEIEDYDSSDWEDAADALGITKTEAKKIVNVMEDLYKKWKNVEVTEGYELTVTFITEGSELDEPEEEEETIRVYKLDGRWVPETVFSFMFLGFLY